MYCVQCEEISPCNCPQSKHQPKCLECSYVLTPPRCRCGQPTYCWHCEEITPCQLCGQSVASSCSESQESCSDSSRSKICKKNEFLLENLDCRMQM
ncbi:hypothetical protein M8J75_013191 [Diaphorina citri]|nr:hypothetical protein M8J75_013191 [Diaphorina citri]